MQHQQHLQKVGSVMVAAVAAGKQEHVEALLAFRRWLL